MMTPTPDTRYPIPDTGSCGSGSESGVGQRASGIGKPMEVLQ